MGPIWFAILSMFRVDGIITLIINSISTRNIVKGIYGLQDETIWKVKFVWWPYVEISFEFGVRFNICLLYIPNV